MYSYHRLFNAPLNHHCRYWAGLHWYHVSPTQKTRVPHASKIDTSTTILGCLVQLRAGLSAYANNAFTLISLIIVLGFLSFLSRLSRCWTTLGCLEFDSFLYTLFSVFVIRLSPLSFVFLFISLLHFCFSFSFPFFSSHIYKQILSFLVVALLQRHLVREPVTNKCQPHSKICLLLHLILVIGRRVPILLRNMRCVKRKKEPT